MLTCTHLILRWARIPLLCEPLREGMNRRRRNAPPNTCTPIFQSSHTPHSPLLFAVFYDLPGLLRTFLFRLMVFILGIYIPISPELRRIQIGSFPPLSLFLPSEIFRIPRLQQLKNSRERSCYMDLLHHLAEFELFGRYT